MAALTLSLSLFDLPHGLLLRLPCAPALYPNLEELGDYMGLALNSDEVQRNLALVPVADSVSTLRVCVCACVKAV